MSKQRPLEERVRAFGLFMDYHPLVRIAEVLEIPLDTIRSWSQKPFMFDGNPLKWMEVRDLCEAQRGLASSDRDRDKIYGFDYDKYIEGFRDSTASDLEKARKRIIDALEENDADGNPLVKPSLAQLPKIVEAELLLQGKATKIIETQRNVTILLGQVIRHVVDQVLVGEHSSVKEILLDRVEDGFARVMTTGADEKEMQKMLKKV